MLQGGVKPAALFRIVPQPVQKLGEAPLRRIGAAAPVERRQSLFAALGGDLGRLAPGAVVAPQIIVAQRLEMLIDRNDRGAGGVDRQRFDKFAAYAGMRE